MLASAPVSVLLGTARPEAAKAFYKEVLGLAFVGDDGFALLFDSANARIRLSRVPAATPPQYAVLAFNVENIEAAVDALAAKGVVFQRYPFFAQDGKGVWSAPDGTKVAWFLDPDLNLLSLVQPAIGL